MAESIGSFQVKSINAPVANEHKARLTFQTSEGQDISLTFNADILRQFAVMLGQLSMAQEERRTGEATPVQVDLKVDRFTMRRVPDSSDVLLMIGTDDRTTYRFRLDRTHQSLIKKELY